MPRTSVATARFGALQLGKSEPPRPLKARRLDTPAAPNATLTPAREPFVAPVPAPSCTTTAIRVEEIRSIAREVASREVESKKAARLRAVGIRLEGVAADESALALQRMFPHLVRPSLLTIAMRVVFFIGYVASALSHVGLRAVRHVPLLAAQARDGLHTAWGRAVSRASEKPRV